MKNNFFNWNKTVRNKVLLFSFFLFMVHISYSQCAITGFTVAKTNATCFSNGEIKVSISTGQTGCDTRFATITPVTGSSNTPIPNQTQTLTFLTAGGDVVFGSLPAGKYNVAVSDGITTTNYVSNPVAITSSYTPMSLTLSSTAPTCTLTSSGYTQNGTFTTTVIGGTGPFEYKLTSVFGVQTFNSPSRTQVFNNIKAGENVSVVVTDKVNGNAGCQVSVTQNFVTSTAVPAPLAYGFRSYNFIRDCGDPLQSKIKFNINLDNLTTARLAVLQQPGNAKIRIGTVDYPLTYVPSRNGFIYDAAAVNGPELVHGMTITTSFNWECGVLTRTSTVQMPNDWFNYSGATIVAPDCSLKLKLTVIGDKDDVQYYTDRNIYFCPTNSVEIARRISINPDVYQVLSGSDISPDPALTTNDLNVTTAHPTIPSANSAWTVNEGGYYRITVSDQYHTVVRYYDAGTLTNPLSNITINPTSSVLEGTSGFKFPGLNAGIKYPVSVKVERTDGQTLINHTAAEPLSLAGTYTYNFPMFVTWNSDPGVLGGIYDLPPGEYRFTLTDGCSNTKVFTATNATYANYSPTFSVTQGCNNSNSITFNLNKNGFAFGTNWAPSADVNLYTKNSSGGFGNFVQAVARTGTGSGTFVNLASGSYFVQFNGIGLGYSTGEKRTSPTSYFKEVVIPDYQNFTVSTGASICDTSNLNSGIVSAQITGGTYTYPITFSLFSTSNSAVPLATYVENDTSKVEHSFTNLATGNYFVRVASSCYSVDQNVSISTNVTAPRAIVSDPAICPLSPTTLGAISATNGLYDITWTNDADPNQTVIATGMPVVLSPAATIKYRATFKLKDFLACVNPPIYTSTVDVTVNPNPDVSLAVSDIDLCLAPTTKTVTISSSQLGYKYEIVKMDGSSFVPPLSGIGSGGNLAISFPSSFNFAAGTTLKVKTSNGSNSKCTDYLTDLVTISQSTPIKTLVVQSTDVCQGFTSTIKVKASQSQIVYLIKKNGVPISSIPAQTGNGADLTFTIPASQLTVGANTFTVQASNSTCGTTDLDQVVTITVTASPVANAGAAFIKTCITNPNGKEIGMTAVTGINYSWSPATGLDNATIANPIANPTNTTTYTLTAADGTCTATSTVKVTVITTVPSVNAGTDFTKTCSLNPSGKLIGAVIQGQSATYAWTPITGLSSATNVTPTANPTVTTTYRVTATETSSGCTNFDEVLVTVDTTQPSVPIIESIEHPTCLNSTGTITVTSSGNIGDYYSIDNGVSFQLSNVFNSVTAGTHLVKIKSSANGCISNATSAIINPQPLTPVQPTISAGTATTFCLGGSVVLTSSATSGNHQWYQDDTPITGATSSTYTATAAGTYTVTNSVTNPNTIVCTSPASAGVNVVVNALPVATINDGVTLAFVDCTATTIQLTASPGSSYVWYRKLVNETAFSVLPDVTIDITATNLGFYKVKVIDSSTNCEAESQVTQVVAKPAVSPTVLQPCVGNTVTLESNTTSFDTPTFRWKKDGIYIADATTHNRDVTEDGEYTVEVTDGRTVGNIGTQTSCGVEVHFNPLPVVEAGTNFTITCTSNPTGLTIGETPEAGFDYVWTSPKGISGLTNATIANPVANPTETTTYTVRKTNLLTLCWKEDTITITVDKTAPTANAGTPFTKTCVTNTLGKEIGIAPIAGLTYSWSPATGLDNAFIANPNANPETTQTYTLTVENTTNGCTAQATVLVTVDLSTPTADAGTAFTKTCATNTTGQLIGATAESGVTYSWYPTTGLSDATISNPNANPTATTTYTVTARKTATGCTSQASVLVTVDLSTPTADAGTAFTKTCATNTTGQLIGATAESGVTYSWYPTTGLSDATISNPNANPTATTTYTVTARKTATGCTSQSSVLVSVDLSTPTADAGTAFTKTCATNSTGQLIGATAESGVTYSWFPTTGLSDATSANPNANPTATTTYTVTARKTTTGCTATNSVIVTVLDTPNPVALSTTIANNCPLENVDLTTIQPAAVSGIVYEWWTGTATTRVTQITNPTLYATAGTIYLWSKSVSEGCYNAVPSAVNVTMNVCCESTIGVIQETNPFYLVNYAPADITTLEHVNYATSSVVRYAIVNDLDGKIKQINTTKPEFTQLPAGNYTVHAFVFGPTVVPTGLVVGNKLAQVVPFCGTTATKTLRVQSICSSAMSYTETLTNAKQYALLDTTTDQFVQVNTTGTFTMIHTGMPHQVIGFNYSGTATGIQVGGTIAGVTATNLDITAGAIISGCTAVTTQIDGNIYNDKDKRCIEGLNNQTGLPLVTLYAKLLDSSNQVIAVSSAIQYPNYTFSMTPDLLDGVYSIVLDDNDSVTDAVATYPNSWKGNAQTFTIASGQIVEYLSNTANFVPMCMQAATNKPVLKPTANLVGNTYNFCKGVTATSLIIDALPGATINWYTTAVGGVAKTTPLIPTTSVVGTTTCYVSQTLNGAESDRTEVIIDVHDLPEQPTAISGSNFIAANTTQLYGVVNSSSAVTYNWILPTDWTGTSTSKDITVQVGTKEGTIGVTATSAFGCISPIQELVVRVVIEDDIEVYNSLSPNGDGDNDIFRIRNIDFYPENTLSIFNRWGIEVYRVNSYGQNDNFFKGFSDGRSTVSRDVELPEGAYFYTLTYKNTKGIERNLSGYLYIKQ